MSAPLPLGLGRLLIADGLSLDGPQFRAVAHQNFDEIALRLNGRALFYDENGHQSIGEKE